MKKSINFCYWFVKMNPILILMISLVLSAQPVLAEADTNRQLRIIGGEDAPKLSWPWITSLEFKGVDSSCGGALIHPYWILTAAHCVESFESPQCVSPYGPVAPPLTGDDLSVVVGLHKQSNINEEGERLEVSRIIQHPLWNPCNPSWPHDLALLQLKEASTQPLLSLASPNSKIMEPDTMATAIGWGLTDAEDNDSAPDILQQVDLPLVSNETCQTAYTTEDGNKEYNLLDNQICAGFKEGKQDTCTGDSGGPLVVLDGSQYVQVGIVSYGGRPNGPICAGPDAYGVYTRVSTYIDFIKQYVPLPTTAGVYDGAFISSALPGTYLMLRNTAEEIVLVFLNEGGQSWQALLGELTYPNMTLTSLVSPTNMVVELEPTLSSPSPPITELTLTVLSCRPFSEGEEQACLLSNGKSIKLEKIF
jgi:secreted trypsin-like serine protease